MNKLSSPQWESRGLDLLARGSGGLSSSEAKECAHLSMGVQPRCFGTGKESEGCALSNKEA